MGNHLFSATDLMSLLLSLCLALLFHSLLSPPPASLYFCALSCPNSPQSLCKPQISHCPLFAGFLRLSTLDSFFLSFFFFSFSLSAILPLCPHHHGNCWPSGYFTYRGQFPPHVHNWPFGPAMSVHVPLHCLFLHNAQSVSH